MSGYPIIILYKSLARRPGNFHWTSRQNFKWLVHDLSVYGRETNPRGSFHSAWGFLEEIYTGMICNDCDRPSPETAATISHLGELIASHGIGIEDM